MKKTILIIIFVFTHNLVFTLEKEEIDAPFDFNLGSNESEIIINLGEPKVMKTYVLDNNKYTLMFYDNIRISMWYMHLNQPPLISVVIFSPSLTVFNGIHVGMNYDEVKKMIGKSENESHETQQTYFGKNYYIYFTVNKSGYIFTITWTYFLD